MPTRFRTKKHTPFLELPRHKRRAAVVRLGWKIAQQTDGRGFWTDHLMEDPEDPHRVHSWVDVYFLGADRSSSTLPERKSMISLETGCKVQTTKLV